MDELELLEMMIEERDELLAALVTNPRDVQALRKARALLGIPEPEPIPLDDPRRYSRRGANVLFKGPAA